MYLYNITINVDNSIFEKWMKWMKEEHLPEMMNTGCFSSYKIFRLLEIDDSEGPTFAIQFFAETKADYNRYITIHAEPLRKKSFDKWGDKFIAFRSVMEEII